MNKIDPIFTYTKFWTWFIHGMLHGCLMVYICFFALDINFPISQGYTFNLFIPGMLIFTISTIVVNIKVFYMHYTHYGLTILIQVMSVVVFFIMFAFASDCRSCESY